MKECPACRRCFADDINHCPDDGEATAHSIVGEPVLDGRYQLERRLGHGGMGVVFHARHIFLKTQHAIKVILPDLVGNDPMLVTRFRQEALAAAAIRHQNIIAVTDFGVVRGVMPFLVMEYVKGCSLQDVLAAEGRLPPARALELMSAVCAGVGAAHRQNIVHRDLKPLNIMLQDGVPVAEGLKVLDFGLAKIKSGELLGSFVQAKTSGLMGSPFYMAPEQWSDEEPDVRADIYSLGVILYQMLAGEVPFRGSSIPSIMKKHLTTEAPSFASFNLDVPASIERVVNHALAKEASHRPQSVEQLIHELRDAVSRPNAVVSVLQTIPSMDIRETIINSSIPSGSLPSVGRYDTTVSIHSFPSGSRVFINNVAVGVTNKDGLLVLNEMLRGQHQVVVLHEGYEDWSRSIDFPGGEFHLEANLRAVATGAVSGTIGASSLNDSSFLVDTQAIENKRLQQQEEERLRLENEAAERLKQEEDERARVEAARVAEEENRKRAEAQAAIIKRIEEETRARLEKEAREKSEAEARLLEKQRIEIARIEQLLAEEKLKNSKSAITDGVGETSVPPPVAGASVENTGSVRTTYETQVLTGDTGRISVVDSLHDVVNQRGVVQKSDTAAVPVPTPARTALPKYIIAAVVVVVLVLGGGTYYVVHLARGGALPLDPPPVKKPPVENKPPKVVKADLVAIPGGTFMAGRDEGLPQEGPAHSVTVAPFMMDRTEVTNAEYSQFLVESKYTSPAGWINNQPPSGQEQWPVSNVTLEDVNAFADWRSKRDGTSYRLPTEEEWEFAARSGVSTNLFPWGDSWDPKYANLGTKVIRPVGSFPDGKNKWGAVDLIGNVWEWTSSKIVLYQGNPNKIPAEQLEWVVIRGGSFSSDATKGKAVTAVTRQWVEPTRRDGLLGFRLVRSGN